MGYKPGVVASGAGDKGQAVVIVHPNDSNKIRVKLHAQTWNVSEKRYDYEDKKYELLRSDCSDELQKVIHPTENALVQMSAKGDKIYKFSPWEGMFEGKFVGFASSKNEEPAPRTKVGPDWSYQYFTALIEITKGAFKGARVSYTLRYHFAETEEKGQKVAWYSHPKSKYTAQLGEFMDITGVWEKGPMKYKDNVLPMIQKRMLAEDRTFKFIIKQGNIHTLFSGETPTTEEVPSGSEEE